MKYSFFFTNNLFGFILVIVLTGVALFVLITNFRHKSYHKFWSPTTFISLIVLYYMVINPISFVLDENTTYGGVAMDESLITAWFGGAIAYFSVLLGFRLYTKKPVSKFFAFEVSQNIIKKAGIFLFIIALSGWVYTRGFQLNVFKVDVERTFVIGGISSYFTQAIAFMVAAVIFVMMSVRRGSYFFLKRGNWLAIGILIITIITFVTQGSRYRIVILVIAGATTFYLKNRKKLNLFLWSLFVVLFFFIMGVIELTRNYSRGLDISKLESYELSDIGSNAQNEAKIFLFSGKVIDEVSESSDYIYFEPIITALMMPLPRSLFLNKPDGSYLKAIQYKVFGSSDMGAAFMFYAEYYYAFGWFGVILMSFSFGMLCKFFYLNYLYNPNLIVSILTLGIFNGCVYLFLTRGYLAQQVFTFFYFLIVPIIVLRFFRIKLK